jgi:hypothetical protein
MARWHWVGVLLLALVVPATAAPETELKPDAVNGARRCAQCHQDIYAMWSRSMHSAAWKDPIFQASYMQAYLETRGEAKKICLSCHAPVAALTGDLDLQEEISREGITCDFCHSVVSVDREREGSPFELKLDGIKRGPLADADSPVHAVASSPLHQSSEFCSGCHEYTNAHGVDVFTTYTEWRASPQAAEGKTCQNCHMPETPGKTVRSGLGSDRKKINLHNISGMHSREQVQRAATAKILHVRRKEPDLAVVRVEVANVGSGHSIPTGMPTRKLVLEVFLYHQGNLVKRFERIYQKTLEDERGRVIASDHEAMLNSWRVRDDNRLRPGEKRIEKFTATVPETGALRAEMQLHYSYTPMLLSPQGISIEMASERSP